MGKEIINKNLDEEIEPSDFYSSVKLIFTNKDFDKLKNILLTIAKILFILGLISLLVTICKSCYNYGDLNDGNVSLFIFFITLSGTILFINELTTNKFTELKNILSRSSNIDIKTYEKLEKYLKNKSLTNRTDYSDKGKEVWFKDGKRVFEFIYRKDFVQIAVSQKEKFKNLMENLAKKVEGNLETFGSSYYFVKIPYDKLDNKLVEDIEKIIDETLK